MEQFLRAESSSKSGRGGGTPGSLISHHYVIVPMTTPYTLHADLLQQVETPADGTL
jgi:hypothetical protein